MSKENLKWYIFYCKSRSEKKAKLVLEQSNYEIFLPLVTEYSKWSDRVKKVENAMFKGYLFVRTTRDKFSDIIQKAPQVVAYVKIGTEYAFLRQEEVDFLKLLEANEMKVIIQPKKISKNSKVKIKNGPFVGYKGVCIEEMGSNYFLVAIEALNQEVKLKIHESWID